MNQTVRTGDHKISILNCLRLHDDAGLRREMPCPPERRSENYIARFDALTVFYDCFFDDRSSQVVIICPRLLNLWPSVRNGLMLDGRYAGRKIRRKKYLRVEVLRIAVSRRPERLELRIGDRQYSVPVGGHEWHAFAGRNCLMAISKNNEIGWIESWARYHASAHNADAVILFDNGSSIYAVRELLDALAAIPGIQACRVISAPLPYGAKGAGRWAVPAQFFQTSMFTVAQTRFLASARAVLSVDIDELVRPLRSGTVFDLAAKSALGLVSFYGTWVYPARASGHRPHTSHKYLIRDNTRATKTKWCIVPKKTVGRMGWDVHRPGGIYYPFSINKKIGFWHFFGCTTNWNKNRSQARGERVVSPELTTALQTHLGAA
ncbi:MAG: hypothetical protein ACC619_05800 [Paracoccaceae bacterium]